MNDADAEPLVAEIEALRVMFPDADLLLLGQPELNILDRDPRALAVLNEKLGLTVQAVTAHSEPYLAIVRNRRKA